MKVCSALCFALLLCALLASGCSPRNALISESPGGGQCPESVWPLPPEGSQDYIGVGASVGEELLTWSLSDQNGCTTDWTQFLGSVVMLDVSSVWCGPCNEAAASSMEVFEAIRDQHKSSFLITVLVQDELAGPATVGDAEEWSEKYGLEYPVVVDEGESVRAAYGVIAFPVFLFIAPTGEVYERIEGKPEDPEILELMRFGLEEWAGDLRPEDEIPDPPTEE